MGELLLLSCLLFRLHFMYICSSGFWTVRNFKREKTEKSTRSNTEHRHKPRAHVKMNTKSVVCILRCMLYVLHTITLLNTFSISTFYFTPLTIKNQKPACWKWKIFYILYFILCSHLCLCSVWKRGRESFKIVHIVDCRCWRLTMMSSPIWLIVPCLSLSLISFENLRVHKKCMVCATMMMIMMKKRGVPGTLSHQLFWIWFCKVVVVESIPLDKFCVTCT